MFGKKDQDKKGGSGREPPRAPPPPPRAAAPAPPQAQPEPSRVFAAGEEPPPVLGFAAVTLLDVCLGRMPDIARVEAGIREAGFQPEPEDTARGIARGLALDANMVSIPLRDLRHKAWRKERQGVPAAMLLTTAQSSVGQVVFCCALFGGATEAEAVKTVQAFTKAPPSVAGATHDPDGKVLRRIFWQLGGQGGMQALAVCGPEDRETRNHLRALVAFNRAS